MNTFKNDTDDRETQSLLKNEEVIIIDAKKKKQKSAVFNTRNVLLVGGLVATGGMVGLSGNAKSAASSQNTTLAHALGQDRPTIRLSVGCTPQDVLSLLPFEPKSWRGALSMIVSLFVVVVVSFFFYTYRLFCAIFCSLACLPACACVCVRAEKILLSSSKQQFTDSFSLLSLCRENV